MPIEQIQYLILKEGKYIPKATWLVRQTANM